MDSRTNSAWSDPLNLIKLYSVAMGISCGQTKKLNKGFVELFYWKNP